MGFHTYPIERADQLDDPSRYRYCSIEELVDALGLAGDETVVDLGVGTGFFAADVAEHATRVVGLDLQAEMLHRMRDRHSTPALAGVVGAVQALPLATGAADAAFSTMTFHEYAEPAAHEAVADLLAGGGRLVTVDWTAAGSGDSGPPVSERFTLAETVEQLQAAGFHIERASERPETLFVVATAP